MRTSVATLLLGALLFGQAAALVCGPTPLMASENAPAGASHHAAPMDHDVHAGHGPDSEAPSHESHDEGPTECGALMTCGALCVQPSGGAASVSDDVTDSEVGPPATSLQTDRRPADPPPPRLR